VELVHLLEGRHALLPLQVMGKGRDVPIIAGRIPIYARKTP
jgi:hypothetical protein